MKRKALIITAIILGIVALILFLIGGYLAGWDIIGYIKSPMFLLISMIVLSGLLVMAGIYFRGGD